MINTAVTKLLTVKAAAVIVAVTAAGGVAAAAATGTLPTALTGSDSNASAGVSVAASHRSGKPSAEPSESEKGMDGKGPEGAKGSPSPSLLGLCHAVSVGNKEDHGKALENPAFMALITAAGSKEKVSDFCMSLLASASADPKEHSNRPADSQGDHRSSAPTDHSTGKPSGTAHP